MVALLSRQIDAMADRYPQFKPVQSGRRCLWTGLLTPLRKTYRLTIAYQEPRVPEWIDVRRVQPRVQVRSPVLEPHPEFEEGPIPHVYSFPPEPRFPLLCLFDPYAREWSVDDLIAETTMPWTERWLGNYEFWLATGEWKGGGRHIGPDDGDDQDKIYVEEERQERKRLKTSRNRFLLGTTTAEVFQRLGAPNV
jgi:hypothetical protein